MEILIFEALDLIHLPFILGNMKKKIAVVYGGYSAEKEISKQSAEVVFKHLEGGVFAPYLVEITKTNWNCLWDGQWESVDKNDFSVHRKGECLTFDGVFMAIHGSPGEDGKLQSYFELIGMPHNTSGSFAAAITFDKGTCNSILKQRGIPVASSLWISAGDAVEVDLIAREIKFPCVIKPNRSGSSFGVSIVEDEIQVEPAIQKALEHDSEVLIESFLNGTEFTCGCTNFMGGIQALPVTEIVYQGRFFDYEAKYKGQSQEITPARFDAETTAEIQALTQKIYSILNLKGIARVDYKMHEGRPHVIEINTVPGLSKESLIPQQAREAGYDLGAFFEASLAQLF